MHLLAAKPGAITDGSEAVDLGQTPGEIVVLSAADTEIAGLARAHADLDGEGGKGFPALRLANPMQLSHNLSVDIYVDDIIAHAKLVVVRLLGGTGYWPYGIERIALCCRENGIALAVLPGDDQPDAELAALSTAPAEACHRLWQYLVHGGAENFRNALYYAASLTDDGADWAEPAPLLRAGIYHPGIAQPDLNSLRAGWRQGRPVAAMVFYRALVQVGNLAPVDALIEVLNARGFNVLPVYVASLKETISAETVARLFDAAKPTVILNATGFALSTPGRDRAPTPFDGAGCPVLQVIFSGGTKASWEEGQAGLSARDIAMNVALPEVDGRILSRAVSFKAEARFDAATQSSVIAYQAVPDRIEFVAALAAAWARLAAARESEQRIALIFANYPNRDGRIGNGVGLDAPQGAVEVLRAMKKSGYDTGKIPEDGNALISLLSKGPTNVLQGRSGRSGGVRFALADYQAFFATLPEALRNAVSERWGTPQDDPHFSAGGFDLAVIRLGNVAVGVQPARGYNIDPAATYHDSDLIPPHFYFAFYGWLRTGFDAHAAIHMGKHGNLEWLPGKALALSAACCPEAVFGPMPHLYPFIVNDPGEGSQAKRRACAVIIDHLTPPMTRAETYGPLADLERLVDEYYQASGLDPRRLAPLATEILTLARDSGLGLDCGIEAADAVDRALPKLDAYLCELKEMQIRDGLHVFGKSPTGGLLTDLLVALVRVPRNDGKDADQSLLRALAKDFGLADFDPLDCDMAEPWHGPRAEALAAPGPWRTFGDTVERLELLASALVAGEEQPDSGWDNTRAVLDFVETTLRPAVVSSGAAEIKGLLTGLNGRFVEPGAAGAPTRGRLDVLPTGRNFYSVDTRTVPTPAAWHLGWKSALLLIARHRQEHGGWPRTMVLSAWGTSNMRTGGDDIAQALALIGARPRWDTASARVTGFEILPIDVLDRPRVDVMLRVSGFFRDAFPAQIDLFDSAVRAVAALDETPEQNPLAARVRGETASLIDAGVDEASALRRAGYRVFGSKPGAYGAGLQALIDEHGWDGQADLARAYIAWGGYAYGAGAQGAAEHRLFEDRLRRVEAVVQNQDNREHDLLDSDDYYQFEGGLAASVSHFAGARPAAYHNDHSRPESPRIRTLEEEIARVVRARVVNPKWISGVMRHGYKGGFEMAATVDYLFAFAATAHAVADHHFDAVYDAYIESPEVRRFLAENNLAALAEMAARLLEAQDRGLWRPRANSAARRLAELAGVGQAEMEKVP